MFEEEIAYWEARLQEWQDQEGEEAAVTVQVCQAMVGRYQDAHDRGGLEMRETDTWLESGEGQAARRQVEERLGASTNCAEEGEEGEEDEASVGLMVARWQAMRNRMQEIIRDLAQRGDVEGIEWWDRQRQDMRERSEAQGSELDEQWEEVGRILREWQQFERRR